MRIRFREERQEVSCQKKQQREVDYEYYLHIMQHTTGVEFCYLQDSPYLSGRCKKRWHNLMMLSGSDVLTYVQRDKSLKTYMLF